MNKGKITADKIVFLAKQLKKIMSKMEDCPTEINNIVNENFWELIEDKDTKNQFYAALEFSNDLWFVRTHYFTSHEEALKFVSEYDPTDYSNGEHLAEDEEGNAIIRPISKTLKEINDDIENSDSTFQVKLHLMKYSEQNIKDTIRILKSAEKDFKKPPDFKLHNGKGLCYYFEMNGNLDSRELTFDGSEIPENSYWFCNHYSQINAYRHKTRGYKTARSRWCRKRRLELEAMLKAK